MDVHLLAEPTKLELLKKEYDKKRDELKNKARDSIISKYGGEEHLNAPPAALLLAQTEEYVEYTRSGKIIKGQERQVIRSKYEEDVFPNNHTSVWGSYWDAGHWGYRCCHSFIKNSYCTDKSGKQAHEISNVNDREGDQIFKEKGEEGNNSVENFEQDSKQNSSSSSSNDSFDDDTRNKTEKKSSKEKKQLKKQRRIEKFRNKKKNEEIDKLKEALRKEEQSQKEAELILKLGDRKRAYHSMYEAKEPTTEEFEAYQIKRTREEDPMAQFNR